MIEQLFVIFVFILIVPLVSNRFKYNIDYAIFITKVLVMTIISTIISAYLVELIRY